MSAIKFNIDELSAQLGGGIPVAVPLGTPVSEVRSTAISAAHRPSTRIGLWECTPGRWRRQVKQAEFCHFLEGSCSFTPDGGTPIEIGAGDVLYFPENSTGVWDIRVASRKIFFLFDESTAA